MAVYPYIVKKNGVLYPAGTEVPQDANSEENKVQFEQHTEVKSNQQYTKTDIHRMTTSELQALATENGVDNANEITGGELKKILFEKLGL